jgi:glycosyltransferase involved in cell wall biosynthesis
MIKIGYNYQTFTHQRYGGISRIFSEIAPLIDRSDDFNVKIYAGLYQNKYLTDNTNITILGRQISYPAKGIRFFLTLNPAFAKIALEIDKPDIVHETYYSSINTVPKKSRTVITVLDMIHEKFADSMGGNEFSEVKSAAIKRADSIICISNNTKKDLVQILNIDPDKISVVYLSHTVDRSIIVNSTPIIADPYILYVGLREDLYKNFERLLRAYASNKHLHESFKLVCFGPKPFSKSELDLIKELKIDGSNVLYYSGDDSVLANFYTHAAAFIYPSLYEGFGIPPLEAMSFNCPVVCSNTSSIPEVVGDAGEYFDPYDIDSISAAIEKVVFSSTIRQDMIYRGRVRIGLFSWDKCAKETESVYKKLMNII